MLLAAFFILAAVLIDFFALKSRGDVVGVVLMVIGFGFSIIALPFIVYTNPQHVSAVTIGTPSGNVIVPAYNVTSTQSQATLQLSLVIGFGIAIILFVLAVFSVGSLFFEKQKKAREKFNN